MNRDRPVVLVVGATGRTGRLIVEAAARHELQPRALVRDPDGARPLVPVAEVVKGDLEDVSTLTHAVSGIDAVIFAHGSDRDVRPDAFERIDYGGVAHVLRALDGRRPRIVLLSTFLPARTRSSSSKAISWRQECRASRSRRPPCAAS